MKRSLGSRLVGRMDPGPPVSVHHVDTLGNAAKDGALGCDRARLGPITKSDPGPSRRMASVDPTDARKATVRRFGRSDRRAQARGLWTGRSRPPPRWKSRTDVK